MAFPVVVRKLALWDQIGTLIGQILTASGAAAAALGMQHQSNEATIAGSAVIILSAGWRVYRATVNHNKLAKLCAIAPDEIGVVK